MANVMAQAPAPAPAPAPVQPFLPFQPLQPVAAGGLVHPAPAAVQTPQQVTGAIAFDFQQHAKRQRVEGEWT